MAYKDDGDVQTSVAVAKSNHKDKSAIGLQGYLKETVMRLHDMDDEWESLEAQMKEKIESIEVKIGSPSFASPRLISFRGAIARFSLNWLSWRQRSEFKNRICMPGLHVPMEGDAKLEKSNSR